MAETVGTRQGSPLRFHRSVAPVRAMVGSFLSHPLGRSMKLGRSNGEICFSGESGFLPS